MRKNLSITGILTGTPPGTGQPFGKYVYQTTVPGAGNDPTDPQRRRQIRRWVITPNPNTPAQQTVRNRFTQGVAAWHSLTNAERDQWRKTARARQRGGFQYFMSVQLS